MNLSIKQNKSEQPNGFTLVEIMIVLAILAVLASLSIFNNSSALEKTWYVSAKNDLLELTNHLEREYLKTNNYPSSAYTLPFSTSPRSGSGGGAVYQITYQPTANLRGFTITATPTDARAQRCGPVTLNNVGQWTNNSVCE